MWNKKIKLTITETAPIQINKASYTFRAIKEDARIRVEQDSDLVFQAIKKNLICEEFDKHLLQTYPKANRLLVHENRPIVKDGISMRKYYGECGQVTHHQILIPEHLITELLKAIHEQINSKISWDHKNDPRLPIKVLLPRIGKKDLTMGFELKTASNTNVSTTVKTDQK